ncbi:MAG: alpha/beta hydrolase [Hymenobacteraceae bacterium]|nr:alpha/beta hydrolase [Hymenobacteraceae bacterium]MDX5397131.1 alpha/beta hydrolase [Hymenobacteraceae bacterium]MDX5513209.1 alpha/beta hydrolase [Hymenobacteraceae bacterium]
MKKVYLISGLATDDRVFKHLQLQDVEVRYLPWLKPDPDESMEHYAQRMCGFVDTHSLPILIGYSFGGIMAIEMAKQIPTAKVITISSINTLKELPWNLTLVKATAVYKYLPAKPFAKIYPLTYFIFGTETREEEKMLKQIVRDADPDLLNWSVAKMLNWSGETTGSSVYRIHGTHDRVFPYRLTKKAIPIKNGTHLMVISKAKELSAVLNKIIHAPANAKITSA